MKSDANSCTHQRDAERISIGQRYPHGINLIGFRCNGIQLISIYDAEICENFEQYLFFCLKISSGVKRTTFIARYFNNRAHKPIHIRLFLAFNQSIYLSEVIDKNKTQYMVLLCSICANRQENNKDPVSFVPSSRNVLVYVWPSDLSFHHYKQTSIFESELNENNFN